MDDKKLERILNKDFKFMEARLEAEKKGEREFTCPLCGGHAWWGRASINNHLHCGCRDCGYRIIS